MNDSDLKAEAADKPAGADIAMGAGAGVVWFACCLAALGISALTMKVIFGHIMQAEYLSGWLLASINAGVGVVINIVSMTKKNRGFVIWGAGGNVLRFLGVVVIVLLVKFIGVLGFEPFAAAFLSGYFVFMIAEMVRMNILNFRSMRGQ